MMLLRGLVISVAYHTGEDKMAVKNPPQTKDAPDKTATPEPTADTKRAIAEFHAGQGIPCKDADDMFAKNGIKIGKKAP
jgi:hypothetical protein